MLAKAVDVGRQRKVGFETEILRLEDDRVGAGGEENFLCARPVDGERERRLGVVELYQRVRRRSRVVGRRTRDDGFGNLVANGGWVRDFDVNPGCCQRSKSCKLFI